MERSDRFQQLFEQLFLAKNENEVDKVIATSTNLQHQDNWYPLSGNENNFGIIENQQSSPVAAIVEKLTNSIDAILMRRCYEEGINPQSADAPESVEEAVIRFFPDYINWDMNTSRNQQAENIQIIGDGYRGRSEDTSLIIYDDGEGQHPHKFEDTFLSLVRGNKNEIHFVQGKYNMGGSGAIVFCGKKRYQLIASKRFDGSGLFGFTLIRKHPFTAEESRTKKNTWYEYLKIAGEIPAFSINELDLGIYHRKFTTGTIIKLYSYDVKGNKHVRRDLSRSLNEYLYEPALPIYGVETEERYPNDNALYGALYGLKRRLEDNNEYVEDTFSEKYQDPRIGRMKITVHVFKARAGKRTPTETKKTIQDEFFKNRMAVLFSVNGQVHGHYTSEFISRSLGYTLLRDYLLIHVDCTEMQYDFRSELFMASRDRLKQGEEAAHLRQTLADNLKRGELKEIFKRRKDSISVDIAEDDGLLKSFAAELPINDELRQLLSKTFKLDSTDKPKQAQGKQNAQNGKTKDPKEKPAFTPKRYPTFFKLTGNSNGTTPVVAVPLNGERTLNFDTDVENQYFDRAEDPGDMEIAVMTYTPNQASGGTARGSVNDISAVMKVARQSPRNGTIKVVMKPNADVNVGDEIQIKVDLKHPGPDFTQILRVKIAEPRKENNSTTPVPEEESIGLPKLVRVYQSVPEGQETLVTWDQLGEQGIDFNHEAVMYPMIIEEILETIYINMDSSVLKAYKGKIRSEEQHVVADRRYISSIYFHTLFLYTISKKRGYTIARSTDDGEPTDIDLTDYLKDMFSSHYAAFLLNFGMSELMDALG